MNTNRVDVSIYILTYNHEDFISQAIESVLSQKTKYKFEIVISDDCSSDGTQEIIKDYATKYPDKINININNKNLGIPANIYKARCMCKGRYIVGLGGDDYWINNNKIEMQTDFLEKNKNYYGVATRVACRKNKSNVNYKVLPSKKNCLKDYTLSDYEKGINYNCHGLMIRNSFNSIAGRNYYSQAQEISNKVDDAVDQVLMLRLGKFYTLDFVTDVYRVYEGAGNTNFNSKFNNYEKTKYEVELYVSLYRRFGEEIDFRKRFSDSFTVLYLRMLLNNNKKSYIELLKLSPIEYNNPIHRRPAIRGFFGIIPYVVNRILGRK